MESPRQVGVTRAAPVSRRNYRVGLVATGVLVIGLFVSGCTSSAGLRAPVGRSAATSQPLIPSNVMLAARYAGGILRILDGQPVYVGFGAVLHAQATSDAKPFLVGGWFGDGSLNTCSGGDINRDPSPLLSGCGTVVGGNAPFGPYVWPGPQGQMDWNGHSLPNGQGPAIVRVHTHDPMATACRPDTRAACEAVLVVDAVLWTGDAWTHAAPLTLAEAVRRLGHVNIVEQLAQPPNGVLVVQRHLFVTPHPVPCSPPWPHELFDIHGDPRFALVAAFPDTASRQAAQAKLDPARTACQEDPRIVRPGAPAWVGQDNVLVLVYGGRAVTAATQAALASGFPPSEPLAFPATGLDESYRVVLDWEAARATDILEIATAPVEATGPGYDGYVQDAYRRFTANALTFVIGRGLPATEANVGASLWSTLARAAVPGTARVFIVNHPASTDPALRQETLVAFRLRQPSVDSWSMLLASGATY